MKRGYKRPALLKSETEISKIERTQIKKIDVYQKKIAHQKTNVNRKQ